MKAIDSAEREEVRRFLASTDLFRDLDESTFRSVEEELEWVTLQAGGVLVRQGEEGDSLFVLLSGRLRAFVEREQGVEEAVGEISPGEAVGDMAILTEERRSATVRAIRHSLLVRLTRIGFERLEARHPQMMKHMARLLVRRLRQVNVASERRERPLTVGIIAVSADVQLADFCRQFVDALSRIDSTSHVTGEDASQHSGVELTNWLSELERRYRFVVYQAGEPQSEWTQRVVQQSDRILILVAGDQPPAPEAVGSLVASGVAQSTARKDIVLLHPGTNRSASGTARWLKAISADGHFHVWMYSSQDFERIARVVAGKSIGLVLGGGGARGFTHIGVIHALLEAGIPIDFVGGTSIGALIAAECALGWDANRMREANRAAFRESPLRGDYTLPIVSVVTPKKTVKLYETLFGEAHIEDQWRTYFCIACNLTRGEMVIHREGLFKQRVQASSAMPAVDSPVIDNGDLIVDGGVINNLPADVMQKLSAGRVIAVDVSPRRDLRASAERDSRSTLEGARVLRPGSQSTAKAPGGFSIMMRTIMLNSVISADSMKRHMDLYLKPPVEHIEMFDWSSIDEAADIGYRYAKEQLGGFLWN
ncbi:MAG: patatin-like phospholipase family protein [Acidobacteria bacterium]|nr:patatin-like phospholipase family protein [Acidobacteriota bacterium]